MTQTEVRLTRDQWREVQKRLDARGFNPGPIDGLRGPKTDSAIIEFKRSIGYVPRKFFGPLTYAAIMDTPEVGEGGEMVLSRDGWKNVQSELKKLGFYFGVVDGIRGSLTDNAIVAFKKSIGYRARPFFGPLTYDALMTAPPAPRDDETLPWILNARKMLGLHERRDRNKLMEIFRGVVPTWALDPVEISWCGSFVAVCLKQWKPDIPVPDNILGARQWGNFGTACTPQRGAILTFWRISRSSWQGHVGFMVGQDNDTYHILGGNQSDAVTIARLEKSRMLTSRWPSGYPLSNDRAFATLAASISRNEA